MPIYEYMCVICGNTYEAYNSVCVSADEDSSHTCQKCKGDMARKMSSGFFKVDASTGH